MTSCAIRSARRPRRVRAAAAATADRAPRRRTTRPHRRSSRTRRWAAAGSTTSSAASTRSAPRRHRRRPRRVRHRARRRRHLPARPTSTRTSCPTARSGSPTSSGPSPEPAAQRRAADDDGVAELPRRPEPGARRLRALRPARRPRAVPAGPARARRCPTRRLGRIALLRIGSGIGADDRRACSSSSTTAARRSAASSSSTTTPTRPCAAAVDAFRSRARHRRRRSSAVDWSARRLAQDRAPRRRPRTASAAPSAASLGPAAGAARHRRTRSTSPSSSSSTTCAARRRARCARCHARYQQGIDDVRLRGRSWSRTARTADAAARRGVRRELRSRVPLHRPRSTMRRRRRRHALNRGHHARARGTALALDDRRRARAHAGRAAVRARRASRPTSRRSSPRSSGTSGPGQQGDAMRRRLRPGVRGPAVRAASTGRTTATACSRSATSSATATGSTASGRATACSCPGRCSSRSAASTRASRWPAAATPTSSSTSGSARRPTSPSPRILGEGSFHQVHGGTTTNQPDPTERRARVFGYGEHYAELRGRTFRGPGQADPLRRPDAARPRCDVRSPGGCTAEAFAARRSSKAPTAAREGPSGPRRAEGGVHRGRLAAACRGRATTWLGRRIGSAPTDLLVYQEIIAAVRPDWIDRDRHRRRRAGAVPRFDLRAGRARRRCSSIDDSRRRSPSAPRGSATSAAAAHEQGRTRSQVRELVGDGRSALVVLGSCADRFKTSPQFDGLCAPRARRLLRRRDRHDRERASRLAGVRPWPGRGGEADPESARGEFVPIRLMEKYSLTFNPGGFLKRVR